MRAIVGDLVVAEAPEEDLVRIEGNWYFPRSSVTEGLLVESPTPYTCPWKGAAQYWSLKTEDGLIEDAGWSYPELYDGAVERVGRDFAGHVAFGKDVSVVP
jgi:uncharacterized protein (DUF427 family)